MDKEIIWTNPINGKAIITIPSNNIYVPVDLVEPPTKKDLVCFQNDVPGVTIEATVPGNPEKIIKPTHRKATPEEIADITIPLVCEKQNIDPSLVTGYHVVNRVKSMSMDNYFRDAWVINDGEIDVDMTKAVDVHKEKLRQERAELFAPLDLEQKKALVSGDTTKVQEVEAKLQALRDVTNHQEIASAATLDELKVAGRSVLKK